MKKPLTEKLSNLPTVDIRYAGYGTERENNTSRQKEAHKNMHYQIEGNFVRKTGSAIFETNFAQVRKKNHSKIKINKNTKNKTNHKEIQSKGKMYPS